MRSSVVLWGAKLFGLAMLSAGILVWWLGTRIPEGFSFQQWRVIPFAAAAGMSGLGAWMANGWIGAALAVSLGLVGGAAWTEFWLTDITLNFFEFLTVAV